MLIAFSAMIGTLVPQREASAELVRFMPSGIFSFLQKMEIFNVYSSGWFFLLLGFLAVNLMVCSLDRFPLVWRQFRIKPVPENEEVLKEILDENRLYVVSDVPSTAAAAEALLQRKYSDVARADESGRVFLCARKGRWSNFGAYIIHLSILVLIAGAFIGSVFGIEAYVNITEGSTVKAVQLKHGGQSLSLPFQCAAISLLLNFTQAVSPSHFNRT